MSSEIPYFKKYLDRVRGDLDRVEYLKTQSSDFLEWCESINDASTTILHMDYTWTLREVLNHLTDSERVFSFRALWFARGSNDPLPGFDEKQFSINAGASLIAWPKLIEEFRSVRLASIALFSNLPDNCWRVGGSAAGYDVNVSILCDMIIGHVDHHFTIMRSRLREPC